MARKRYTARGRRLAERLRAAWARLEHEPYAMDRRTEGALVTLLCNVELEALERGMRRQRRLERRADERELRQMVSP